ncbi:MAG: glycosyltransferase family 39 protein [Myxococcota bacterium]
MTQASAPAPLPDPATPAAVGAPRPEPEPTRVGILWQALARVPPERLAFTFVVTLAASMLLPYLGAVGLYDPWETHYAEVSREMVARDDYVHPHWKEHYFFSKPVLLFWLSAVGFKLLDVVTGQISGPGNFPALTELAARLPVALIALLCVFCLYRMVNRFFGRAAAVLSSVVLCTMPFFIMVGRQHITDMPFVGLMTAGLCLMVESLFGTEEEASSPLTKFFLVCLALVTVPQYLQICRGTQLLSGVAPVMRYVVFAGSLVVLGAVGMWLMKSARDSRAHFFYLLCGLATLAKGLPGILLPGLICLAYTVCSWEWWRLRRIRAVTGSIVLLLVAAPWFVVMSLFTGRDDEQKTFFQRFWIHDHLNRLGGGVHGERGTFEYYIKQLGFGCMPWSGLLPFAWLKMAVPEREATRDETQRAVRLFVALWALTCFALFSISTTKFHHYILPMVPPLSICAGVFLAELWEKRESPPLLVVLGMAIASVVIAQDLWRNPHMIVDLFTYHYVSYKPDYYMPTDWPYGLAFGVVGLAAAGVMVAGALVSNVEKVREHLNAPVPGVLEPVRWVLRELVEAVMWLVELPTALVVKPAARAGGRIFVTGAALCGLAMGYFLTDVYFLKLAPHWSQRYLFNTYYSMKQGDEPIIAYLMNWRGESFYSKGLDAQINDGNQLKARVKQPGREFILVETTRYKGLENTLGADFKGKINIVDRSNSKWYLVLVDE